MYAIRSVTQDLTSYNNFQWKAKGFVEAPDFSPTKECGGGLHALLLSQSSTTLWYKDGKFLLLNIDENKIIDLGGKIKFPSCEVIECFDSMNELTIFLYHKGLNIEGMFARTQISNQAVTWTGGDCSNLTGGDRSVLASGSHSILVGGYHSTLTAGNYSTLTAEHYSTITGGYSSTITGNSNSTIKGGNYSTIKGGYCSVLIGGDYSTLNGDYESIFCGGDGSTFVGIYSTDDNKGKLSIAYVGENGIEPNIPYKINNKGNFIIKEVCKVG